LDPDPLPLLVNLINLSAEALIPLMAMAILLAGSAFASASEVAFFSLRPKDIKDLQEDERPKAQQVIAVLDSPDRLLATLLVINNFFNIGFVLSSGWAVQEIFNLSEHPWLMVAIQMAGVTALLLVLGEVIPKTYAGGHAKSYSMKVVHVIASIMKLTAPLVTALTAISKLFEQKQASTMTVDQLEDALELTDDGSHSAEQHKLLKEIVRFGSTSVKEIMTPRKDMFTFEMDMPMKSVVSEVAKHGFSRIPVHKEALDVIAGVLHVKDLLGYLEQDDMAWTQLLREPFFVTEGMKIDDLLGEFRQRKMHLAIVVDEFGGVSGLVTLEDVMEEIVGEIADEFDQDEQLYSKLDNDNFVFEAKAGISDMCRIIDIDMDLLDRYRGEADTVAGLLLEVLERMPDKGEQLSTGPIDWTVEAIDNKRIVRVKIHINR
jgi:putative hemolysin